MKLEPRSERSACSRWRIVHALLYLLLFGTPAHAQTSQFLFDPNGNLTVQLADSVFPPQIIGQPQNQVVGTNESAAFSIVVADLRLMTFQWRFNGSDLNGETGISLSLDNVTESQEGAYQVVLTNPSGSVTSAPAMLWIDNDSDGLGDSWELTHFGNLSQTATRDFDGDGISNAREFRDGSDPTDPNSARYRLLVIREGGAVFRNPDQTSYNKGQSVALTVTAGPHELFHAWLGDVISRDNPVTLVMTNDKTVYARFTPIPFTWTNGTSGNWETAANWTPNLVPGLDDVVLITSDVTVTLNSAADCAEVTLGSPLVTLTGNGTLRIRDNLFWTGGTMSGSGRTILETNAVLNIQANVSLTTRTLENRGTLRWSAPDFNLNGNAVVTNAPGALFRVDNQTGSLGGAQGRFDNAGVFRKSTGAGALFVGSFFNNFGTVELEAGTLLLNNGGTNSGNFALPAGTALTFGSGTHAGTASSSITGAGHIAFNSTAATFAGLVNVSGSNTFSSGTVNLSGQYISTNNALIVSGGIVNLTGNHFCSNNVVTISSGTLNFSGTGLVEPATLNLSFGTLDGSATVTIREAMNWSGGTMSGSGRTIVPPGVTLQMPGSGGVGLNTRTLENAGTVLWTGPGDIGMSFGSVITNCAGALFQVQNAVFLFSGLGANRFDNAGTFRKSTSTGTTSLNGIFNNSGRIEIQTGTLFCSGLFTNNGVVNLSAGTTNRFAAGGSASGVFSTPATALVEWTGGTFTLNGGAQLNGAGLYKIDGSATVVGDGDITVQNLDLVSNSGEWNGTGILTIANAMNWTAGGMDGSGRTLISPTATLQLGSASSASVKRTLENGGNAFWTGAGGIIFLNGVITNRAGALFQAQSSAPFSYAGGSCRFDNAGTFRKSSSTGTTTVFSGVTFNNSGTMEIQTGTLLCNGIFANSGVVNLSARTTNRFAGGGSSSDAFTVPSTALVEWIGGTFTLNPGSQLNGAGLYKIDGSATVVGDGDITVQNLDLVSSSGTWTGTGILTIANAMNWTAGDMRGSGRTLVSPAATLQLGSASSSVLVNRILENSGNVVWTGAGGIIFLNGVIINRAGALFQAQSSAPFSYAGGSCRFDNAGTFRKSSGTGTTTIPAGVNFTNFGTVDIRGGILAANGGYASSSNAVLNCALGGTNAGTGYGQLQVAGAVTLNGTLSVDFTDGFSPALNDSFTVLTAGTRNGAFASFLYPSNAVSVQLSNTPSSVVLRVANVFAAVPAPLLLLPELIGSNVNIRWTAVSNAMYRLEFNPDLANLTNWNPVPGDVTTTSNTASKLDPLTPSNRLYRVRVLP